MATRTFHWLLAGFFRLITAPFIRYEFRGGRRLDERDAWILSANHRSLFDFPHAIIGLGHWRKDARILIASEFWDHPVWVRGVKAINAIPVFRRTDPQGSFSAAVDALRAGDSICMMPEGQLTWDPADPLRLRSFKTGVSRMAVGAEAPILPIALVGGERVWPKGTRVPRLNLLGRKVVLCWVADEPLWLSGDDHRANAEKVREVQHALLRQATAELQRIDPTYLPDVTP